MPSTITNLKISSELLRHVLRIFQLPEDAIVIGVSLSDRIAGEIELRVLNECDRATVERTSNG